LKSRLAGIAAGLALLAAPAALGCGHCVEDRIAAVYDHAVIDKARERHQQVAFFALAGPLLAGHESRRFIARALASEPAVDLPSLRVSVDSASLSLAYDGTRISHERIGATLNRRLAARGLQVTLLKVTAGVPAP
jgi:hypothetical protein